MAASVNGEKKKKKMKRQSKWEEVRCPICLDHPHKAVLLICSSHEKGCRPFVCDTNRHLSNCFDRFCNMFPVSTTSPNSGDPNKFEGNNQEVRCPLCRSQVSGWIIAKAGRAVLNKKVRECPLDSCEFSGNYVDLKKHANRKKKEQERRWVESGLFIEDILDEYETDIDFILDHPELCENLLDDDDDNEVNAVYLRPGETYISPDGAEVID